MQHANLTAAAITAVAEHMGSPWFSTTCYRGTRACALDAVLPAASALLQLRRKIAPTGAINVLAVTGSEPSCRPVQRSFSFQAMNVYSFLIDASATAMATAQRQKVRFLVTISPVKALRPRRTASPQQPARAASTGSDCRFCCRRVGGPSCSTWTMPGWPQDGTHGTHPLVRALFIDNCIAGETVVLCAFAIINVCASG